MEYISAFAPYITGLVEEKRSLGYKYSSQPGILRRFDKFCTECYPHETVLSREIVLSWAFKYPGEHPGTLQGRITPVKELAGYMLRQGKEAFVLPKGMLPRKQKYTPHIYSNEELKRIFAQSDQCHACQEVPYRHYVMPVFFRLLYGCGLRLSEARLLKVKDVDLFEGVITITNVKLDKHRQIPVSPELLGRLKDFSGKIHAISSPEVWFFPGYKGKPMATGNVEKNFRKFLWQVGISHGGRGKGPRVHDFRHTMAIHCLRRWVLEKRDLQAHLPVLQAYLGHVSMSDTAYYLHLTGDLFPNITEQTGLSFGSMIPKAGGDNCDENN